MEGSGTSKGMKTIHREIKKEKAQIFGKQIFAGPCRGNEIYIFIERT